MDGCRKQEPRVLPLKAFQALNDMKQNKTVIEFSAEFNNRH